MKRDFIIQGRVPGDDDDSVVLITADDYPDAYDQFVELMHGGPLTDDEREYWREHYSADDGVYTDAVFEVPHGVAIDGDLEPRWWLVHALWRETFRWTFGWVWRALKNMASRGGNAMLGLCSSSPRSMESTPD